MLSNPGNIIKLNQSRCFIPGEAPSEFLKANHLFVPVFAEGKVYAILHLVWLDNKKNHSVDFARQVAQVFSEHIGLSINNILLTQALREQTLYDPLTQLYNHYYFQDAMRREVLRATREGYSIGIVMLDLDNYTAMNENAGDLALREIAHILSKSVRASDIISRHEGERFILALPGVAGGIARVRAEEIRLAVRNCKLSFQETLIPLSISAGIAFYPLHGPRIDNVLSAAESALQKARENGGNQILLA